MVEKIKKYYSVKKNVETNHQKNMYQKVSRPAHLLSQWIHDPGAPFLACR